MSSFSKLNRAAKFVYRNIAPKEDRLYSIRELRRRIYVQGAVGLTASLAATAAGYVGTTIAGSTDGGLSDASLYLMVGGGVTFFLSGVLTAGRDDILINEDLNNQRTGKNNRIEDKAQ